MKDHEIIDKILNSMEWEKAYDFKNLYIRTSAPVNDFEVDLMNKQMFEYGLIVSFQTVYYSIEEMKKKNQLVKISFLGMQVKEFGGWKKWRKKHPTAKKDWWGIGTNLSTIIMGICAVFAIYYQRLSSNQDDKIDRLMQNTMQLERQREQLSKKVDSLLNLKKDSGKK